MTNPLNLSSDFLSEEQKNMTLLTLDLFPRAARGESEFLALDGNRIER